MAYATVMKLRKVLVERAGKIYAERNPCAPGEMPIEGKDLTTEQLKSVTRRFSRNSATTWTMREFSMRCRWRQLWRSAVRRMHASAQEEKRKSDSFSVLLSWATATRFLDA
ncbi:unnamed protein product [Hapterophycus canaliculatus]